MAESRTLADLRGRAAPAKAEPAEAKIDVPVA